MAEDRWTEENENLVAMELEDELPEDVGALPDEASYEKARHVLAALADRGLLVAPSTPQHPRTWTLPEEPGPEVTVVRCECHAQHWYRDEPQWISRGYPMRAYRWPGLVANHPRLTDATGE